MRTILSNWHLLRRFGVNFAPLKAKPAFPCWPGDIGLQSPSDVGAVTSGLGSVLDLEAQALYPLPACGHTGSAGSGGGKGGQIGTESVFAE